HRLYARALEVLGPAALADRFFHLTKRTADRFGACQVKLHTADVGLVGDREGMELEDDRKADGQGGGDGLVLGCGDAGFHGGDAIGGEDSLGFDLCQNGPSRCASRSYKVFGCVTGASIRLAASLQAWRLVEGLQVVKRPPHESEN